MGLARLFVLLWFLLAFTLSASGWFERFSSATLFGIGTGATVSIFTILFWMSSRFRRYARAGNLKRLTRAQLLRFFGILALIKANQGVLPGTFAIPTGVMDILIAATSLVVAARLVTPDRRPRPGFFVWHVVGLLSLAISTTLGILTSSTRFGLVTDGITSQPMTWFPMSLAPTFIGPLVLICHLLALVAASPYYAESRIRASERY
ncbi:MAG: hypothetical protein ABIZ80_14025 [Bryobacteraceae bacterium]